MERDGDGEVGGDDVVVGSLLDVLGGVTIANTGGVFVLMLFTGDGTRVDGQLGRVVAEDGGFELFSEVMAGGKGKSDVVGRVAVDVNVGGKRGGHDVGLCGGLVVANESDGNGTFAVGTSSDRNLRHS